MAQVLNGPSETAIICLENGKIVEKKYEKIRRYQTKNDFWISGPKLFTLRLLEQKNPGIIALEGVYFLISDKRD